MCLFNMLVILHLVVISNGGTLANPHEQSPEASCLPDSLSWRSNLGMNWHFFAGGHLQIFAAPIHPTRTHIYTYIIIYIIYIYIYWYHPFLAFLRISDICVDVLPLGLPRESLPNESIVKYGGSWWIQWKTRFFCRRVAVSTLGIPD